MKQVQGFGKFTLPANGSKQISIRQVALTHLLVNTSVADLKIEVDYFGKNTKKLIEKIDLKYLMDIKHPSKRYVQSQSPTNVAVPIGHLTLYNYVLEVTLSSVTGGDVSLTTIENFISNDYLIISGVSAATSKQYENIRTMKKLTSDDIQEVKIFEGQSKVLLSNDEVDAVGELFKYSGDETSAFIVREQPEVNHISVEFGDTTKKVFYTQYIFETDLIAYSRQQNQRRVNEFISNQGSQLNVVKLVQKVI